MRRKRFVAATLAAAVAATVGVSVAAQASPRPTTSRSAAPVATAAASSQFVTRVGTSLRLSGRTFRFGGADIYWLGLDENVGGVAYPTTFRIDDALTTAVGLGATVVRSHTLGISVGNRLSLEPSLDVFNDAAFGTIDYAIADAHRLGLRLIVPLTDNWHYYHGGKHTFTDWYGDPESAFYTDPRVIAAFERYVDHLLDHVNPLTGLALRNDPTVMAWELGNELSGVPDSWTRAVSAHLKKITPHQLVAAGSYAAQARDGAVDLIDDHYYPPTATAIRADAATATAAGKAYVAGEYGSSEVSSSLLTSVAADPGVSGAVFWSLFGHADTYGFVQHDDGFTLHYPGDDAAMRGHVAAITAFDHTMCGCVRQVSLTAPLITSATSSSGANVLAWRGVAMAVGYRVQRSTRGANGPWSTVSGGTLVTDDQTPWTDHRSPRSTAWYRVIPVDAAGHAGPTSAPVRLVG
jgi:hypothetical protein